MKHCFRFLPIVMVVACVMAPLATAAGKASQSPTQPPAEAARVAPEKKKLALPAETSRYNRGGVAGRYRDADGKIRLFALAGGKALIYDGGGRVIGTATEPVKLNVGAGRTLALEGKPGQEACLWAFATDAGVSGWVARGSLLDPPGPEAAPQPAAERNPPPPREAAAPLKIDAAAGREQLQGLVHMNSQGVLPKAGGNRGEHYAGRHPGSRDYVYLLFAVPNVQGGGVAKDSIPDGGQFIPGLDEQGRPIVEVMTMYRAGDWKQPVRVAFLYGRAAGGTLYGWLARANVGERILFLGNSMTLHGPNPAIGWTGNWGMAASAPEKDFVHIIIRSLAEKSGAAPKAMIRNLADFERQYGTYDAGKQLKEALDFKADTVIVAIGENVPKLDSGEAKAQFKASLLKLLRMLKTNNHPAIYVRSCFWANPVVDPILKEVCQEVGATFIDISALGKEESNYARSERQFKHAGVARHPGDRGMQAMAKAILAAMEKQQGK